ncbi:EAL domain-containing protein [Vibrio profundi]|uniref:EAL domain-containing protein n=1 Tax=Vibrio profundi TaxID=1774960 RepID=UPI00373589A2
MTNINRLHFKILILTVAIVAIVLAVSLWSIVDKTYRHSETQLSNRFNTAANVVQHSLNGEMTLVRRSMETAAQDFTIKQLISGGLDDPESLRSALMNYQRRIDVDIILVVSPERKIITSTSDTVKSTIPFNSESLTTKQLNIIEIDGVQYLASSVSVKYVESTHQPDAWLIAGINLYSLIDKGLVALSGFSVSVLVSEAAPTYTVLASTLPLSSKLELQNTNGSLSQRFTYIEISKEQYVMKRFLLGQRSHIPVYLALTTLKSEAFLSFNSLTNQLWYIIAFSIFLAIMVSFFVSRGVTRPLNSLVTIAKGISQGDYSNSIPTTSTYEVQSLSRAFISMQEDIKNREQEINQLAYFSSLTSLPNRNHFYSVLKQSISTARVNNSAVAILQIDIDRFKVVNDTLGHDFGDKLLKAVADRMQTFSSENVFISHMSADVFAVICTKLDTVSLNTITEQFHQYFELPFVVEGISLDLSASMGGACFPDHADNGNKLMQCADIALNVCKQKHSYFECYHEDQNTHSVMRLNLLSELKASIADDQLELYYQPKLDLINNRVHAVECLVRWHHPIHGFVQPDDFIPLAEQSGHIRALTHWAIRTALLQHSVWRQEGYVLQMAVNISAIDLVDFKLPVHSTEMLSELDVDADYLKLEVTESAIMSEPKQAIKALNVLHRMGIKLSIDDFGTGYSSMAQLKKMPVNELKIDKSFVLDLASSADDKVIVRSTLDLAHNLNLSVVAEGVEDLETLKLLERMGCDVAQGYYLSRPMPASECLKWLKDNVSDNQELIERPSTT